jgi:dienelactone hydrolase
MWIRWLSQPATLRAILRPCNGRGEGAQHGFTKPGPAYQEKADKESWAAMKKFFAEVLK